MSEIKNAEVISFADRKAAGVAKVKTPPKAKEKEKPAASTDRSPLDVSVPQPEELTESQKALISAAFGVTEAMGAPVTASTTVPLLHLTLYTIMMDFYSKNPEGDGGKLARDVAILVGYAKAVG